MSKKIFLKQKLGNIYNVNFIVFYSKTSKVDRSAERMLHYEKVLEANNIEVKDEILNLIKKSEKDNFYVKRITDELNRIDYNIESDELKEQSDVIILIVTINYKNSSSFKKNLIEAINSKKQIFVLANYKEDPEIEGFKVAYVSNNLLRGDTSIHSLDVTNSFGAIFEKIKSKFKVCETKKTTK